MFTTGCKSNRISLSVLRALVFLSQSLFDNHGASSSFIKNSPSSGGTGESDEQAGETDAPKNTTTSVHRASIPFARLGIDQREPGNCFAGERLRWHYEFPSPLAGQFTAVAEDGTVYATDALDLYAVAPNGTLNWSLADAGGGRPIAIDPQGRIYTARADLVAVSPAGALQWRYTPDGPFVAGPSLGPDGNLYAATDTMLQNGFGAFSINTSPAPRWTDPGDPAIFSLPGSNWPVVFADGRAVYGITTTAAAGAAIWAFDLDGNQDWFGSDLSTPISGKPPIDPLGRIITVSGSSVIVTAPDGSLVWERTAPQRVEALLIPGVAGDGTIYTADTLGGERWALNPDGTTRYFVPGEGGIVNVVGVTPDASVLLLAGNEIGDPGFVRGFDAQTGEFLWQADLDPRGGFNEFVRSLRFSFSPANDTAYFTTRVGGLSGDGRLYALALDQRIPGDMNCDGFVDNEDIDPFVLAVTQGQAAYQAAWPDCNFLHGDINGDGAVDNEDIDPFVALIAAP